MNSAPATGTTRPATHHGDQQTALEMGLPLHHTLMAPPPQCLRIRERESIPFALTLENTAIARRWQQVQHGTGNRPSRRSPSVDLTEARQVPRIQIKRNRMAPVLAQNQNNGSSALCKSGTRKTAATIRKPRRTAGKFNGRAWRRGFKPAPDGDHTGDRGKITPARNRSHTRPATRPPSRGTATPPCNSP